VGAILQSSVVPLVVGASRGDDLRLILFGLLFLGWLVKTLFSRKAPGHRPPHRRPQEIPWPEEPDEAEELPPAHAEGEPAERRRAEERTAPGRGADRRPVRARREGVSALPSEEPRPDEPAKEIGSLAAADEAARLAGERRRREVRERLGLGEGVAPIGALRAGMLWSEVLGPPRAVSGPHLPPGALRARLRR
jgi:hypothetical protein